MMKYGLDISPAGDWGRPDQIAELAALGEDHGWDGVFCEDYLAFPGGRPTYDVWITLGLVAHATTRLTLAPWSRRSLGATRRLWPSKPCRSTMSRVVG